MRKTLSWNELRQFISDQRTEDINHLCGLRIFPTEQQVRDEYDEICTKIATRCSIETHKGENGELPTLSDSK